MFTNNGKHIQISVSFVDSVIYHDFRDLNIFCPLFGFESQIMTSSKKCQKSDFLDHCSFTQVFHDVEKVRRKPKIFVKVIQRFLYVQHVGLIFLSLFLTKKYLVQKSWWWKQQYIFFVWRFCCLEAEQKPVKSSLSRNCRKLPCTETRIAQPPKQVHRSLMWHMQDNGQGYLFL